MFAQKITVKPVDSILIGFSEGTTVMLIERYQIDLGRDVADEPDQSPGVFQG
jgi:hypothetical protein